MSNSNRPQDQRRQPNSGQVSAVPPKANQFRLLSQRRFAAFFWTQFLGAGNDNLFKFALTVLITYQIQLDWLPPAQAGIVISAVFIAPYLLFSATSGQLADKLEKSKLFVWLKTSEILIVGLGAAGFASANVPLLLLTLFLMGAQSAVFGPVKYAYMPQHLDERELTGGNGLVEMGTFVAILLGNLIGGLLVSMESSGTLWVAAVCLVFAIAGRLSAGLIPASPATDPHLKINWNPFTETLNNLRIAYADRVVFRSLLGISWMWFFGAIYLAQFPAFARDTLGGDAQVASLLLIVFSVGIGAGSLACEQLSRRHVEIGLVPFGAIGMTVFSVELYFACQQLSHSALMGPSQFLSIANNWRIMLDMLLIAFFTGLYSVPMYALIQKRSRPSHRARIIAANNILNSGFVIVSALMAGALVSRGFSAPEIFLVTGILNAVVAGYIFFVVPEYLLRFLAWILSRIGYRFVVAGDHHIPESGPAIITPNHVSFVDAVLIMAASPRPVTFLMDHKIFKTPLLGMIFRLANAVPVAPQSENPKAYAAAMQAAVQTLRGGGLVGIFPEGRITDDGKLNEFRPGLLKIRNEVMAHGVDVPIIPIGLQNLWGSYFSRIEDGKAMKRLFRRGVLSRAGVNIGEPLSDPALNTDTIRRHVAQLLDHSLVDTRL